MPFIKRGVPFGPFLPANKGWNSKHNDIVTLRISHQLKGACPLHLSEPNKEGMAFVLMDAFY